MKICVKGGKVNFIDENNVLVGFDLDSSCCEYARWWLHDDPEGDDKSENDHEGNGRDLTPYAFHRRQFKKHDIIEGHDEEGGRVTFKLIAPNKPPIYLTIANSHNGYYGHGFHVDIGGRTIWEGSL